MIDNDDDGCDESQHINEVGVFFHASKTPPQYILSVDTKTS